MLTKKYEVIEFDTERGDKISVEIATDQQDAYVPAGGEGSEHKKAKVTFEKAIGLISPIADGITKTVENMQQKPDEFEVTFHIAFTTELNIKLLTLGSDANMEIKLVWREKDNAGS